jgi:hypothetical protein
LDVVKEKTTIHTQTEADVLQVSAIPILTAQACTTPDAQLEEIVKVVENMVRGTRQSRQQHNALAKESSIPSREN